MVVPRRPAPHALSRGASWYSRVGQSHCPAVPRSCRARVRTSSFTFARGFSSCPVFAASHAPKKLPRRRACASSLTVHGEIDDMRPVTGHRLDGAFTRRAGPPWPWSSRRCCQKYMVWLTPSRSKGVSKIAMSLHRVRLLSPVTHGTRARPPRSICGSTFKLPFISGCRCIIPIPIAIPPPSASCVSEPRPRARNSGLPWAASNGMLGLSLQFLLYLQGWHAHSPEFLAQALEDAGPINTRGSS